MKRCTGIVLSVLLIILSMASCSQSTEELWQEQYDLGVRYLSDGNYDQAIIAFTAANEIDPKRAEAYVSMADVYIRRQEFDKALALLQNAWTETENNEILARVDFRDWALESPISVEELTIGGISFYLTDIYAGSEAYPPDIYNQIYTGEDGDLVYRPTYHADGNTSHSGHLIFQQFAGQEQLSAVKYSAFGSAPAAQYEPEFRNIIMGENFETTLEKLGFTNLGVEYIQHFIASGADGILGDYESMRTWESNRESMMHSEDDCPVINWIVYDRSEVLLELSWWNDTATIYLQLYFCNDSLDRLEMSCS